jgi:benzoylformate decarboxylase
MKGYELFEDAIESLDLYPVFGNPGTTEIPMLRKIKGYILTLHDSISVGMADGAAQASGDATLVNLHDLPGVANSMAFIHTAMINRSPVIITAGQQDMRHAFYDPLLYHNLLSLVGDAVKYKIEVTQASDIAPAIARARSIAMTPPMGPVFLSFPMNVMDQESAKVDLVEHDPNVNIVDNEAVREIVDMINHSSNPALVYGYEIDAFNAHDEAVDFAHALGCPVYGEPLGSRAMFRSSDLSYAGDLLPATTLINLKLLQHDLIVFVGGDITLYPYLPSPLLPGKNVLFVGMDISNRIGQGYTMNPKLFLTAAKAMVSRKGNFKRAEDYSFATTVAREKRSMGLNFVMSAARKNFEGYTIVDESISASPTVRSVMGYSHLRYFSARSGQLGWGIPAAMGIATVTDRVLLIIGDGSFMYTVQSLWTAKRYGIPLKILVLNNGGYSILKSYSKSYYPGLENADFFNLGLDIASVAKGFGVETRVAGADLEEMAWLREGKEVRVLVVNVNSEIPKLFL